MLLCLVPALHSCWVLGLQLPWRLQLCPSSLGEGFLSKSSRAWDTQASGNFCFSCLTCECIQIGPVLFWIQPLDIRGGHRCFGEDRIGFHVFLFVYFFFVVFFLGSVWGHCCEKIWCCLRSWTRLWGFFWVYAFYDGSVSLLARAFPAL